MKFVVTAFRENNSISNFLLILTLSCALLGMIIFRVDSSLRGSFGTAPAEIFSFLTIMILIPLFLLAELSRNKESEAVGLIFTIAAILVIIKPFYLHVFVMFSSIKNYEDIFRNFLVFVPTFIFCTFLFRHNFKHFLFYFLIILCLFLTGFFIYLGLS